MDDFDFKPLCFYTKAREDFWNLHDPPVRAWLSEMHAAGDPWWHSAKHAAYCLVSFRESAAEHTGAPHWREFDVESFLFHDLHEGGTVAFFGSVEMFFEHIVAAFVRFLAAGIIEREPGKEWLAQLHAARPRFLAHYADRDDD